MSTRVGISCTLDGAEAEVFRRLIPVKQRDHATDIQVTSSANDVGDGFQVYVSYRGRKADGRPHERRSSVRFRIGWTSGWLHQCFPDFAIREAVKTLPTLAAKRARTSSRNQMLGIGVTG